MSSERFQLFYFSLISIVRTALRLDDGCTEPRADREERCARFDASQGPRSRTAGCRAPPALIDTNQ